MTQLLIRRLARVLTCALFALVTLSHCGNAPSPLAAPARVETVLRRAQLETATYVAQFPSSRELLETDAGLVVALPPVLSAATMAGASATPAALPIVFMLHGMCGQPSWSCDALGTAGRADSWMVCPGGNDRCGDRFDWKGDGERKAAHVDRAAEEVRARWPELVSDAGDDVLVGFSRGAFVARDVAYARPGRYRGLVLIGASLTPDPKRLLASGVRRVVLASGDFDDARSMMLRAAAVLIRGGVEARFVSTGRIYHQLPRNLAEILAPHIDWVRRAS